MAYKKSELVATTGTPTDCARCAVRERALFQGVPLEQLSWTQRYRENQYRIAGRTFLFEEGESHPFAYTLYSGWIMLSQSAPGGRRQVLRFVLPGDFLGFQANLQSPMNSTAYAVSDCRLCAFPRDELFTMMKETPELASRMAMLSARDMAFMQQVLLATSLNAREKLVTLIMQLFIRVRALGNLVPETTDNSIVFPVSQEMLGDALGMSAETVSRILRTLREDSILELKSRRLTVHDETRALQLAELDTDKILQQALL